MGLNVGFFLLNRVYGIRSLCNMSIGIGLLRAHCPLRNSHERKSESEFKIPFINSISKSKEEKIVCHLAKDLF